VRRDIISGRNETKCQVAIFVSGKHAESRNADNWLLIDVFISIEHGVSCVKLMS